MSTPTSRDVKRAATARRILEAAQVEFGERGAEAATVRGIAQRAEVDPSLVLQHYGSKANLFAAATRFGGETGDPEVAEHLFDVVDARLRGLPPETRALMRSMLTAPEATAAVKSHLDERVANLARTTSGDDAELRAALTVSSILGLTIARHFLGLDALSRITEEQIAATVRPWIAAGFGVDEGAEPTG